MHPICCAKALLLPTIPTQEKSSINKTASVWRTLRHRPDFIALDALRYRNGVGVDKTLLSQQVDYCMTALRIPPRYTSFDLQTATQVL